MRLRSVRETRYNQSMFMGFSKLYQDAFGLDVSDFTLKIAKLSQREGTKALTSFGEYAVGEELVKNGEVQNKDQLASTIISACQSVQGEPLGTPYVVASLPEEKAFLQVIQLPRMERRQVREALTFEAENYVPYPLETVYLDHEIVSPLKNHLDHLDILLAALPKSTVDSYVAVLDQVGLIPIALEIESLAVLRAVIQNNTSPVPLLVADLGATRTSLSVFAGHSLRFTTSLQASSFGLTEAVAKYMGISLEEAEEKKRAYGLAFPEDKEGRNVFEALVPVLSDLAEHMRKYMEYYASHAQHQHLVKEQSRVQRVMLCGGAANLKGLPAWLASALGVQVELANPWVNILPDRAQVIPTLHFEDSLRYATALGLALRGIQPPSYD
ncbi:MAG: type IV pilus assembly protein PilM [Candidatus Yanofskybacteria bacterium]|nr:type IV pilus assembly protein PilM [Candidatus Yanofskybacteria bacterium]